MSKILILLIIVIITLIVFSNYNQTPYEKAINTLKFYCKNKNLEISSYNLTRNEYFSETTFKLFKPIKPLDLIRENEYISVFDKRVDTIGNIICEKGWEAALEELKNICTIIVIANKSNSGVFDVEDALNASIYESGCFAASQ